MRRRSGREAAPRGEADQSLPHGRRRRRQRSGSRRARHRAFAPPGSEIGGGGARSSAPGPLLGIITDSSRERGITGPPGAAGTGDIGAAAWGTGAMGAGAMGAGAMGAGAMGAGAKGPGNGDMGPVAAGNAGAGITIDRSFGGAKFGPASHRRPTGGPAAIGGPAPAPSEPTGGGPLFGLNAASSGDERAPRARQQFLHDAELSSSRIRIGGALNALGELGQVVACSSEAQLPRAISELTRACMSSARAGPC